MTAPVLSLRGFGVSIGARRILHGVDLDVPSRGVVALMGPGGSGKSTLLRTICGLTPSLRDAGWTGCADYLGQPLGAAMRPEMVAQNARAMVAPLYDALAEVMPQRDTLTRVELRDRLRRQLSERGLEALAGRLDEDVVALSRADRACAMFVRALLADPALVCLDEPTAGLEDDEAEPLLALVEREASRRAVLFVTHHQRHARRVARSVALLAAGRIHEHRPTEAFFETPQSAAAQQYVRTGGCLVASPDASEDELDPEFVGRAADTAERPRAARAPEDAAPAPLDRSGRPTSPPRGFRWLVPGRLAGTPAPGVLEERDLALTRLRGVGVTVLASLTERRFPLEALAPFGLGALALPMDDMQAPGLPEAAAFLDEVDRRLAAGDVVALHCKAGLGRTGTLLAAWLVHHGRTAAEALTAARTVEPRWVQSEVQEQFLRRYESWRSERGLASPERPDEPGGRTAGAWGAGPAGALSSR